MTDFDSTDLVFRALAHVTRRQILDIVKDNPGCTVGHVADQFDASRIVVMKHLKMLYDSELVLTERQGRTRHLYLNVVPIQLIYDRWTDEYGAFWGGHLADLKYKVERGHKNDREEKDSVQNFHRRKHR